jgi:uncharacterized protein YggT (Ycf19 family)
MMYLQVFNLIYLLLILRLAINYFRYTRKKSFLYQNPITAIIKIITDPLIKPFVNIIDLPFDFSPVVTIGLLHFIGEPIFKTTLRIIYIVSKLI